MDGNGRWAKARGLPRRDGHAAGTEAAKALVVECRSLGIAHLSLYTFSKENWARPKDEVAYLFELLTAFLNRELKLLMDQDVSLRVLGEVDDLPLGARQVVRHVIKKTQNNTSMVLNLALNYSGRDEILRACRRLVADGVPPEAIDEHEFAARLYTAGQPDPDLVVRTSGEHRLSNYLLFQSAYAEFHFTDTLWPDFGQADLHAALADFAGRSRRFGKTGEQVDAPGATSDGS